MAARVFSGPCLAAPAMLSHCGGRGPAVLTDVLVPRPPDLGFELDGRILIQRGQLRPPGLANQQPLGVIEDRQQRLVHQCPPSLRAAWLDQIFPNERTNERATACPDSSCRPVMEHERACAVGQTCARNFDTVARGRGELGAREIATHARALIWAGSCRLGR
jgi:hypothetical protein